MKLFQLKINRLRGRNFINHIILVIKIWVASRKQLEPGKMHTKMKPIKSCILQYIPKAVFTPRCTHSCTVSIFVTSLLVGRVLLFSADHLFSCIHLPFLWTGEDLRLTMFIYCVTMCLGSPVKDQSPDWWGPAHEQVKKWTLTHKTYYPNLRQHQCKNRKRGQTKEWASFSLTEREEPIKGWIRSVFHISLGDRP